jgi:hypothetical protein
VIGNMETYRDQIWYLPSTRKTSDIYKARISLWLLGRQKMESNEVRR